MTRKPEVLEGDLWHNKEAAELCERIKAIVKAWGQGAICPNEFLKSLDHVVDQAKKDRQRMIDEARRKS